MVFRDLKNNRGRSECYQAKADNSLREQDYSGYHEKSNSIIYLSHIVAKNSDHKLHYFKLTSETNLTLVFPSLLPMIFVIGYSFTSFFTVLTTSLGFCGFSATH